MSYKTNKPYLLWMETYFTSSLCLISTSLSPTLPPSQWLLCPVSLSLYSTIYFCFAFVSSVFLFFCRSPAHIHEHMDGCRKTVMHKHREKHVACVFPPLINLSFVFCPPFESVMYMTPSSQNASPVGSDGHNRRMEQCTMNACWETMGRCVGSGSIQL